MNLSEWADRVGRLILVNVDVAEREPARTVLYARVSSHDQRVVEHRDRLARFGAGHLQAALSAQGRRIVVVDAGEVDDDLIRDMTEVLTSFCARLYGRRGAGNRAVRALGCARGDVGPATAGS